MPEQVADIDAMLDGVELEGEDETPAPRKPDAAPTVSGEKPAPPATDKDKQAAAIDKRIQDVLKKHLANPEAACLMVDILTPGEAITQLKGDFNMSPRNHLLVASGGILLVALATNPEIVQKLREGINNKRQAPPQPKPDPKRLPAPQEKPAEA